MDPRVVRGVPWTLLTFALPKLIAVVSTIVLARLLEPRDFGLLAMAVLTIGVLSLLGDFGLNNTLIVRAEVDERVRGTVLSLSLALGAIVAVLTAATAPLAAAAFDEPRLDGVLLAIAPTTVIAAPGWLHQALLQRELLFRRRFAGQLAQAAVQAAVAIVLAAFGAGVWSLVIGHVAGCVALTVVSAALSPYRPRLRLHRATARATLLESRGFLAQGSAAYASQNADYVAVGAVLGAAPLGFYSMAYRLSELSPKAIAEPIAHATFPGFAQMRRSGEDVADAFARVLRSVAFVACPVGVILSGAAEPFTLALLGDTWLPMVGPLAVLGIWAAVRAIQLTLAWLLNSIGHAGLMGAVAAGALLVLVPSLLLAAELGGITVVAWVMLGNLVASLTILAGLVGAKAGVSLAAQWRAVWPVLVACPMAWVATRGVSAAMDDAAPGLALATCVAAGAAAYLLMVTLADPRLPRELVSQVRRALRPA